MSIGRINKENNVQQAGGYSAPASSASSSQYENVNIDLYKMLEKMGVSVYVYENMSDSEKQNLRNEYIEILNSEKMTGLEVESNPDNQSAEETSMTAEETETKEASNTTPPKPTAEEWKAMTPEERRQYLRDSLPEEIKNLPPEEKEQALKELTINRILQGENITKEQWNKYTERKQNILIEKYESNFRLMVQTGYTENELKNISLAEKIEIEKQRLKELEEKQKALLEEIDARIQEEFDAMASEIENFTDIDEEEEFERIKQQLIESDPLFKENLERIQRGEQLINESSNSLAHMEKGQERIDQKKAQENKIDNDIREVLGLSPDVELTDEQRVEGYEKLLKANKNYFKENPLAENDYLTSQEMIHLGVHGIKFRGEKKLSDIIGINGIEDRLDERDVQIEIGKHLANLSTDEFMEFISSLSATEGRAVIALLNLKPGEHKNPNAPERNNRLGLSNEQVNEFRRALGAEHVASVLALKENCSDDATEISDEIAISLKEQDENFNPDYYIEQTVGENGFYNTEQAARLQRISAELGNKAFTEAIIRYASQREDWDQIKKLVNDYMNSSDKISDEMKDFYNNKVAEITNNSSSTTNSTATQSTTTSTAAQSNTYSNSVETYYDIQSSNNIESYSPVQIMDSYDYNNEKDIQTIIEKAIENPDLISKITNISDIKKVLNYIAENGDKQDLINLIKKRPSLVIEIINAGHLDPKNYLDLFAKIGPEFLQKVARDFNIDNRTISTYFVDNKMPEAIKIATTTNNEELASHILANPSAYGLFNGSDDWYKLHDINNGKKISAPDEYIENETHDIALS